MKVHFGNIANVVLVPTVSQTVGSLGIAILIYVITYRTILVQRLISTLNIPVDALDQGSESAFSAFTGAPILSQAAFLGFWALIGLCVYGATLFIRNALIETHNAVIIENEFTNRPSQAESFLRNVERFCIAMVLVLFGTLLAITTIPPLVSLSGSALFSSTWADAGKSLLGLVALGGSIYFAWMLYLCALHTGELRSKFSEK